MLKTKEQMKFTYGPSVEIDFDQIIILTSYVEMWVAMVALQFSGIFLIAVNRFAACRHVVEAL